MINTIPKFGYGYGDFWLKKAGETRWLVLWSCGQMINHPPYHPRTNWKTSIEYGYMDSVAGFLLSFNPIYIVDKSLLSNYGTKLKNMLIANNYNYYPNNYVYTQSNMWGDDDGGIHFTRDLSVAAWMESSVIAASLTADRYENHGEYNRWTAEAIDYDHVDDCFYRWELMPVETYGRFFGPKYSYKIKRYPM